MSNQVPYVEIGYVALYCHARRADDGVALSSQAELLIVSATSTW
jgi:hypothetical protein